MLKFKLPTIQTNNPWMIFFVTGLGAGMASLDAGIVNVALATITTRFHTNLGHSQWIISIYLLALCAFLPIAGHLSGTFTRRKLYLFGFILFTTSSMFCGIAWNLTSLVIFRLIQGIGAATIMANNQAIILSAIPAEKHGRALGINSMTVAFGSIAGPSIGGLLIGWLGWRSIFYINVPIGLLGYYLGRKILPHDETPSKQHLDVFGAVTFILGITCLLIVLNNGISWGWSSTRILILLGFACVFSCIFVFWEYYTEKPMINTDLFKIKNYTLGNLISWLIFMSVATNNILLPFCLQNQLNYTPEATGLLLFIPPLFIVCIAPLSGYLSDYFENSILVLIGLMTVILGLFFQTFLTPVSTITFVILGQAFIGFGFAFIQSPNNYRMLHSVPPDNISVASSFNSLVRNVGKIFGTVLATTIFSSIKMHSLKTLPNSDSQAFFLGYKCAYFVAMAITAIAIYIGYTEFKQRKVKAHLDSEKIIEK